MTINAAPFADLLTANITLLPAGNGVLEILATACAEATLSGSQVNFQVTLDGNPIGPGGANGTSFSVCGGGDSDLSKESVAILKTVRNVAPGDHVVKLQWKVVGAESSASILVSTGFEHASMRVSEVPVIESDDDRNVAFQVLVLRSRSSPRPPRLDGRSAPAFIERRHAPTLSAT